MTSPPAKSRSRQGCATSFSASGTSRRLPLLRNPGWRVSNAQHASRRCRFQQAFLQANVDLHMFGKTSAEIEPPLPRMRNELRRPIYAPLQYGLEPSALGRVPGRCNLLGEAQLAQQAQAVISERSRCSRQSLVSNLPDGRRSRSRSVLISEWNCSWSHDDSG